MVLLRLSFPFKGSGLFIILLYIIRNNSFLCYQIKHISDIHAAYSAIILITHGACKKFTVIDIQIHLRLKSILIMIGKQCIIIILTAVIYISVISIDSISKPEQTFLRSCKNRMVIIKRVTK